MLIEVAEQEVLKGNLLLVRELLCVREITVLLFMLFPSTTVKLFLNHLIKIVQL